MLLVKGVTPDIFYGTYVPVSEAEADAGADGEPAGRRLVPRGGLMDCLSVYGSKDRVDANTAPPAVLAAVGLNPYAISALVQRRRQAPLSNQELGELMSCARRGWRPLACRRKFHLDDPRHGPPASSQRRAIGSQAHRIGADQVHASRLGFRGTRRALVRHGLEQLTRMPTQNSISRDLRKLLAFGSGVGIEIGAKDLEVVVARVRPSSVEVLGHLTIENYAETPAAEWGSRVREAS